MNRPLLAGRHLASAAFAIGAALAVGFDRTPARLGLAALLVAAAVSFLAAFAGRLERSATRLGLALHGATTLLMAFRLAIPFRIELFGRPLHDLAAAALLALTLTLFALHWNVILIERREEPRSP